MIAEIIGTEHQRAAFAKALPHDAFKCQSVKQARPSVGKTLLGSVMNINSWWNLQIPAALHANPKYAQS